jgi:UDP-N-acetylglucosamine 1-carboxyvinyltransferase
MSTKAYGTSIFIENIFENRYKHAAELVRLGANIKVEGKVAIVEGTENLFGAAVEATDLRGGAALVVAGLAAEGKTVVTGLHHIDRGYAGIEAELSTLGAKIYRM